MRSNHTITVSNGDEDVEVDVDVDVYEEDEPPYSECTLLSWRALSYCEWLTEQMVDDELQKQFNSRELGWDSTN